MASPDPLSGLLDVLQPSLAMYLSDSGIWTYPGPEDLKLALADLVSDHRSLVERAAVLLEQRGAVPPATAYPISFTGCHDADMLALAPRVTEGLRRQVERLDAIVAATGHDGEAHDLAREAQESSRAHLAALEQVLAAERARTRPRGAAAAPSAPTS